MRMWGGIGGAILSMCLAGVGCDRDATAETPRQVVGIPEAPATAERKADEGSKKPDVEGDGLVIGEFELAHNPVVDGDTIRVEGIDQSIRLLSIDTEEKLHGKADKARAEADFEAYLERKRAKSIRPPKAGTPMGQEATEFAKAFFEGVKSVRLERDDPKAVRGRHGRVLAYAFVKKDGRWTSYNIECVRAGMSPYFTKYGYSHRFHNQFVRAEEEARSEKRGIWNLEAKGYGDYDERRAWWDARADFIRAFELEAKSADSYIPLGHWDADERLESQLGKEATVLGVIDKIKSYKTLVRVLLSGSKGQSLPVIFFDKELFRESGIARYQREPVTVRGIVERYEKGDYRTLQIVIKKADQIGLPTLPWPDETKRPADR